MTFLLLRNTLWLISKRQNAASTFWGILLFSKKKTLLLFSFFVSVVLVDLQRFEKSVIYSLGRLQIRINTVSSDTITSFHTRTHTSASCPPRTMLLTSAAWAEETVSWLRRREKQWGNSLRGMSHSADYVTHDTASIYSPCCLIPGDICLALFCGITIIIDWNKSHFPLMPYCSHQQS